VNNKNINIIFQRFAERNPAPTTELNFTNPFECLIAVLLSAQATDIGVNKVTNKLFAIASTPQQMLELDLENLEDYLKSLNYYKTKARHILATCQILIDKFNSVVPNSCEQLQTLPGVGRKTANVVLNTIFRQPTIPVDTHVLRVANRLGLSNAGKPDKVEADLLKIIPKKYQYNAHHWLILHGRYICVARKPKCSQCFLTDVCEYYNIL
jgi:endonuclease-3